MLFLLTFLAMDGSTSDEYPEYTSWEYGSQPMCELNSEYVPLEGGLDLFVKGDMVNLRTGPSTSSKIQTELRLGTVVTVGDCEKEETIGGKQGCWHPVSYKEKRKKKSGYLFSTALTDCRLEVDWDSDGTMEYVYSSISSKGDVQLRVQDPNNAPHVFWATGQNVGVGEEAYRGVISYVPTEQSGQTMVLIQDQGQDYCGGGSTTTYYSYDSKLGIQQAIRGHSYSDAPVYDDRTILFSADKKALVWDSLGEEDVRFEFTKEESQFIRWQKCSQEAKSCEDASEYAECLEVAQRSCAQDYDCAAVSVRKDPKGQPDAFVKYTDSNCTAEQMYSDVHWDFFTKETLFEEVHTERKKVQCLQDGVYKDCPVAKFTPPKNMHMVEQGSNIIFRKSADYELTNEVGRDMTKEELANNGMKLDEEWWVLPLTGPAVKVSVKRHFVSGEKMCAEWAAFYATELEYSGEAISLAIQGTPPEIWNKSASKSMFSKEVAMKLIDRQFPTEYLGMREGLTLADGKDGWQGFIELTCPEETEEEGRYDDVSVQCQVSVSVSEDEEVTFGEFKSVELDMGEPFIPLIRRDIDGDGVEEVLWSGCYDYWNHDGRQFVNNTGNCCGC